MEWSHIRFTHDYWIALLPLTFMLIDLVTGYINAWKNHQVQSSKMRTGITKKAGEIILILIVQILSLALGFPRTLVTFFSCYISFSEFNSNLENLALLGVPLPRWVTSRVNQAIDTMNNTDITSKQTK